MTPAPARHNKGQTEHILKTIAGYESALTVSSVFSGLLYVWLLPAALHVLVGALGLGGHDPVFYRMADSLAFGTGVLGLGSVALLFQWFGRVRANVPMLDFDQAIGAVPSLLVSVKALAVTIPLAIAARFVPGYDHLLSAAIVFVSLALTAGVVHFFVQAARMLWRSSVSVASADAALPTGAIIAVVGWFASLHLGWGMRFVLASSPWTANHSAAMLVSGLLMGTVAILGARFVYSVGVRQEDRLLGLGERVGDQNTVAPVSTKAIEEAWSDSESLIGYDFD